MDKAKEKLKPMTQEQLDAEAMFAEEVFHMYSNPSPETSREISEAIRQRRRWGSPEIPRRAGHALKLKQGEEPQRNFLVMTELSAMLDERVAHYRAHPEDRIPNEQVMAKTRAILLRAHSERAHALRDARACAKRGSAEEEQAADALYDFLMTTATD